MMNAAVTEAVIPAAHPRTLSVDLLAASYRSTSFPSDWSREKRIHEAERYERFLTLAGEGGPATPTREIDEFWHLHMLHPVAYFNDCMRMFGRILDHDGGFGLGEGEAPRLQEAFARFAERWKRKYGEPYVAAAAATNCWHNCSSRCWHACSSR